MSRADAERAGRILGEEIGLRLDGISRRRLGRAVEELGTGDVQALIDEVTVQESGFFREPQHFDALAAEIRDRPGPGVIWSAGCANGQEAWSLAMALEELGRDDWRVVGTEVSRRALERAREATYSDREARRIDPERRARFLEAAGEGRWRVTRRLQRRVRLLHHNLVATPPPPQVAGCAVVFCRNVLIYLHPQATRRTLAMLAGTMAPDGVLFIGASEVLPSDQEHFRPERAGEAFLFRRRTPEEPPPVERAPEPVQRRWPVSLPSAATATQVGEALAGAGLHEDAVAEFRRVASLTPDDPLAHVRLALSLEQMGEAAAARRAFREARRALRSGPPPSADALGGFSPAELERLVESRLSAA